jgi:serpin B
MVWVKEATHGRIEKIVSEIKPDTVLYLINAIYFLADWAVPFAKNATHSQVFHAPAGDVSTDFMHRTGSMTALTLPGATGVALPYTDGDFVFFALLPDKDPRSWWPPRIPAIVPRSPGSS